MTTSTTITFRVGFADEQYSIAGQYFRKNEYMLRYLSKLFNTDTCNVDDIVWYSAQNPNTAYSELLFGLAKITYAINYHTLCVKVTFGIDENHIAIFDKLTECVKKCIELFHRFEDKLIDGEYFTNCLCDEEPSVFYFKCDSIEIGGNPVINMSNCVYVGKPESCVFKVQCLDGIHTVYVDNTYFNAVAIRGASWLFPHPFEMDTTLDSIDLNELLKAQNGFLEVQTPIKFYVPENLPERETQYLLDLRKLIADYDKYVKQGALPSLHYVPYDYSMIRQSILDNIKFKLYDDQYSKYVGDMIEKFDSVNNNDNTEIECVENVDAICKITDIWNYGGVYISKEYEDVNIKCHSMEDLWNEICGCVLIGQGFEVFAGLVTKSVILTTYSQQSAVIIKTLFPMHED